MKVLSSTARQVTNDTTPLTVAGVPVKYGKCVPSKYSVPSTPSTVTLYNRFQCLQDLCASTDDMIHNDIHMIKSVEKHRDNSVHVSAVGDKLDHVKQRSGECKPPQSCSNDMLQPMLADQENSTLQGNKNKTGLFDVVSHSMEEQEHVATLTKTQKVGDCLALDSVCGKNTKVILRLLLTPKLGPSWHPLKTVFWRGIKTKSSLLMGMLGMSVSKINFITVHNLTWQLE